MNTAATSLQVVSPQVHLRGSGEASLSSSPFSAPLPQPAATPRCQERNSLWSRHLAQQVQQGALPAAPLLPRRARGSGEELCVLAPN